MVSLSSMAAAPALDQITDYSQTQRIVLLIDLNPLLYLQNPNSYLTSLLSSAKTFLSFPPLSSSLFSFKPFFSSLSPLLSSSKLPFPSLSLSFNHPNTTLLSLSQTLNSLSNTIISLDDNSASSNSSRAFNVAASMRQLVHDYAWDRAICDPITGTLLNCDSACVRSSLVLLFSPICKSVKGLSEFLNVEINDECLKNVDVFCEKFRRFFSNVNDVFVSRDIHFSWVDVRYELECIEEYVGMDEPGLNFGFFESGIKDLGWGFSSTESIVLGSALVPFGLIYPRIGVSPQIFSCDYCCKTIQAQLSLEILDVSGKPLECKCCDLELVNLNMLRKYRCKDVLFAQEKAFWVRFDGAITKLHLKAVQRSEECVKFEGSLFNPILVREILGVCKKVENGYSSDFFADRILEILARDMGEFMPRKPSPTWKILLSFLYREGYQALVSLSNSNGDSQMGILKPFTVSSALLSIVDDRFYTHGMLRDIGGMKLRQFITKTDSEIHKPKVDLNHSYGLDSQSGPSSSNRCAAPGVGKRKKNKKNLLLLQNLKWNTFYKAVSEFSDIDLEDVYFAKGCHKSKKLKFLKCWMKQIKKSSCCGLMMPDKSKTLQNIPKEIDNRLTELPQESEQPVPSSAAGEDSLTGASRIVGEAVVDFSSETLESFFSNLPNKIQQGVESEGVDLGALAGRLVNSSIHGLYQKREMETTSESQNSLVKSDDARGGIVAVELVKLLLRDPKELAAMHKNNDQSSLASDPSSTRFTSEHIVRQYEMQILFRMEILRSEVGTSIGEPTIQKFVKQICLLLETIQCHLEGGFFGNWSLNDYVGKIIKSRFCHTLEDVVHRIYTKMDLLLFADDDESPNHLLNSEDSNQSWKEKQERDEMGENYSINEVDSVNESLRPRESDNESPQGLKREKHVHKLIEAQEKRERARRFACFTSWAPDLQRVWAPKQPKAMKLKYDPLRKLSKRKDRRRANYDTVCETPMTEKKRSCPRGSRIDEDDHQDHGTQSSGSVSKALFQDNR